MSAAAVCEALAAVLPAGVEVVQKDARGDLIHVEVNGQPVTALWVGRGWPKQVREALAKHRDADVVVAPALSEGARQLVDDQGAGWIEQTGAASFVAGPIVVQREAQARLESGRSGSAWRPSTFAVTEALLLGEVGTVAAVSARTKLSQGTVTGAMRTLTDLDLLEARAARGRYSRRRVADPGRLLERYATEVERAGMPEPPVTVPLDPSDPVGDLVDLLPRWDRAARPWAATGPLAAMFQAPYLQRPAPMQLYVEVEGASGLVAAARELGREPMDGGRLALRPSPSAATVRLSEPAATEPVMWCVPWPRTYADLRLVGVRGEEAAEHLGVQHLNDWTVPT